MTFPWDHPEISTLKALRTEAPVPLLPQSTPPLTPSLPIFRIKEGRRDQEVILLTELKPLHVPTHHRTSFLPPLAQVALSLAGLIFPTGLSVP